MECNKDEATRAKEIAEQKFAAKDIDGAKKFAQKAQNLYPGLDGIPQLLTTLNVYGFAETTIVGEADWYGILGVDPKADDETVRKQYRKLALMLHPDKNKSGSDGAFKLVSQAWSLLSDKAKRFAYDQKRNFTVIQQKVRPPSGSAAVPTGTNGFQNVGKTKNSTANVKSQKSTSKTAASSVPPPSQKPKSKTFWTICHRCKMHYEYLRLYLNQNLLCPNCHESFVAIEVKPTPNTSSSKLFTSWKYSEQRHNSEQQTASKKAGSQGRNGMPSPDIGHGSAIDPEKNSDFQWAPFTRASDASTAAKAASVVHQAYEKVKREREEAQAAAKKEDALRRKNHVSKKAGGASSAAVFNPAKRRKGTENSSLGNKCRETATQSEVRTAGPSIPVVSGSMQGDVGAAALQLDIKNMLMMKARLEIRKKLSECKSGTAEKPAVKETQSGGDKVNDTGKLEEIKILNGNRDLKNKSDEAVTISCSVKPSAASSDSEMIEVMSIDVPDADFHDFDKDRTERSFGENQVWAVYDDDDGMPRHYAVIHSIISLVPFRMKISWLNSKTNSELAPLNWVGSGFSKTCGEFRVGRHEVNSSVNSFSHKVKWSKGTRGMILIYPRRGEVWALYRNWSPDWNELTADEIIHKYDIVEILEDYTEELGVPVIPLVKVAGFKTVFHQHLDPREIKRIPREEMFRFSHHVPSHLLTGQEAPSAPKGCRDLDPAATPVELLEVIPDVKEEEVVEKECLINGNDLLVEMDIHSMAVDDSTTKKAEIVTGCLRDTEEIGCQVNAKIDTFY